MRSGSENIHFDEGPRILREVQEDLLGESDGSPPKTSQDSPRDERKGYQMDTHGPGETHEETNNLSSG